MNLLSVSGYLGLPGGSDGKESACNTGDPSLIPDWEDSMEKGMNGNPLHYSCLENSMDREAWQDTVHGVTKSQMQLSNQTTTNRTDKLLLGDISH